MDESAGALAAAISETTCFLFHFKDLEDPRQQHNVTYPLAEVLLLCLLAVLGGSNGAVDIARFGKGKIEVLRRFLPFCDGTPSHDQIGDILAVLDPAKFQQCFVAWVMALTGAPSGVVAIDGKTLRRSHNRRRGQAAIHMVSAFATGQRLVLSACRSIGQVKVADKSNEIIAIPALLRMLVIEGAIILIDAMGCQRNIAEDIVDRKADYVLALKGNQSSLRDDVELFVAEQKANDFKDTRVSHHQTVDGDHDRIETRNYTVIHDVAWLQKRHNWPGLKSAIAVESIRETPAATPTAAPKIEREVRFYITSLVWLACLMGPVIRSHWVVENGLHWVMDMIFRDDECRIRTDHAPAKFTTIKHIALNLLRRAPGKESIRLRRKAAGWDDEYVTGAKACGGWSAGVSPAG